MSAPSFSVGRKKPSPVAVGRPVPPPPSFDDSGLRRRLRLLEGREIPQFDPSALQARLAELESRQFPVFDPSDLQRQIRELGQRPGRDDFMSIERQLQDLRNRDIPEFDPSNLQSQIGGLQDRLANLPQFDPSQLQAGIAGLEDRLANIPQFDPSQLQAGIQGLSDRISNIPQFDPSALQNRLSELENRQAPTFNPEDFREQFLNIAREGIDIPQAPQIDRKALIKDITGRIQVPKPPSIDRESIIRDIQDRIKLPTPGRPFDPSRLQERLAKLEARETPRFDPTRLRERLSALENREPAPVAPAFDPSRLRARLDALEGREPVTAPPAFDPSSLQERLSALENRQPVAPPAFDTSAIDQRFEDIARQLAELQSAQAQPSPDPVVPPVQPLPIQPPSIGRPIPPISIGEPGGGVGNMLYNPGGPIPLRDDIMFPGGSPTFNERGETFVPPTPDPIVEPTPDPVGVSQDLSTGDDMPTPTLANEQPFAAGVTQVATGLDPLTEQLLFGLDGQGGFIPGAMRAAEKVFYDDQGNPVVIDEQVAGFSPDQLQAMQMQREALGMQDPYLQGAGQAFGAGTQALEEGLQRGRTAAIGALEATKGGVGSLQQGLGESADILRGTLGGYDPSMTDRFYDPFEDRVVQQTITDIMEQGAKSDIGARASDIARGGESAFGSRARLGAGERQEALGRGLAEALGGIRSRGFREAQQTGLGEFARQKAAERAASTGLASLAGQGFGGSQALAGALSGLGQTEQDIGQQRFSGQFGLGTSLQGLGAQAAGASASDIAALYGMGSQQQGQAQAMLDAQRRNLQQRQMTPLLQYQALAPFISMAPAGQFTTTTQFAPPPSPMQAGLGVGLSAFGALGQLYGGGQ
jgi:hypothetical protein